MVKKQYNHLTNNPRYTSARYSILLVVIFSVVNIFTLMLEEPIYFVFSSYFSLLLSSLGIEISSSVGSTMYTVLFDVFALVVLVPYLLCWIYSKKHHGWMIAALVLFAIDTGLFTFLEVIPSVKAGQFSSGLDILFHVIILIDLALGVKCGVDASKTPLPYFAEEDQNDAPKAQNEDSSLEFSRTLNFTREKAFVCGAVKYQIFLNNMSVGEIKNGETVTINVPEQAFSLYIVVNSTYSQPLNIDAGYDGEVINAKVETKYGPIFTLTRIV